MNKLFKDRTDAGKQLAAALSQYTDKENTIVLALPRGGVPIGYEVAKALHLPLDVFLVRKLGLPWQPELAMGAIALGGIIVYNQDVLSQVDLTQSDIDTVIQKEQKILDERNNKYRSGKAPLQVTGKTIILVDDGIATGATTRAAIKALKQEEPKKLVVAIPLAPPDTYQTICDESDEVICLEKPDPFYAIGAWYEHFDQTSDEEVIELLSKIDKEKK